jgi:hypothetical protein
MTIAEIIVAALCITIGVAICVKSAALARFQKRAFGAAELYPARFITICYCILGIRIAVYGVTSSDRIVNAFAASSTCSDRGLDTFMLVVGLFFRIGGFAGYRVQKRREAQPKPQKPRLRPIPPHTVLVSRMNAEQYPEKPTSASSLVLIANGIFAIVMCFLSYSGLFCWSNLLH